MTQAPTQLHAPSSWTISLIGLGSLCQFLLRWYLQGGRFSAPDIYIIDLTTQILTKGFPAAQRTVTLWSDYGWPVGVRGSVVEFLAQVVPDTTARLQVSKGVIGASPTPTPQYVRTMPHVPVLRFKDVILYQLRTTAANAILFSLGDMGPSAEDAAFRRLLARIVAQFDDDPH